jgi:hypothetical protein
MSQMKSYKKLLNPHCFTTCDTIYYVYVVLSATEVYFLLILKIVIDLKMK